MPFLESIVNSLESYNLEKHRILNELYNPHTFQLLNQLELRKGSKVLVISSGIGTTSIEIAKKIGVKGKVTGLETDNQALDEANRIILDKGISNVDFINLDPYEISTLKGEFDIIFMRCILGFLQTPQTVLAKSYSLLKKGGLLILEECPDQHSYSCTPPNNAYQQWVRFKHMVYQAFKSDGSIGSKLSTILGKMGFEIKYAGDYQPLLKSQRDKSLLRYFLISLASTLIDKKFMTEEEVYQLCENLLEFENNGQFHALACKFTQIIAKKPSKKMVSFPNISIAH